LEAIDPGYINIFMYLVPIWINVYDKKKIAIMGDISLFMYE
jgi:hypothetical protein